MNVSVFNIMGFKRIIKWICYRARRSARKYVAIFRCPTTSYDLHSYDFFKVILLHRSIPIVNYQLQDNLLLHTIASCMAGTVATSQYISVTVLF